MTHDNTDHNIQGDPRAKAKHILARHLCGWISGHSAPVEHFEMDAKMIVAEIESEGVSFT